MTDRSVEGCVATPEWQLNAVQEALKIADGNAKFIDHHRVVEWLSSWGTKSEKKRPE